MIVDELIFNFVTQTPLEEHMDKQDIQLSALSKRFNSCIVISSDSITYHGCLGFVSYLSITLSYSFLMRFIRLLPQPLHVPAVSDDEEDTPKQVISQSTTVITRTVVPPYGQRAGWKPSTLEDFGAYATGLSPFLC